MIPALELRAVAKAYGSTRALDGVSLAFAPGEVHALLGRNGAGKSTLIRILAGATAPSSGTLLVRGEPVRLRGPADALARGIATVHQELSLVPELSVAENVLLGRLPRRRGLPLLDRRAARDRAAGILGGLGVDLDPRARVASLSFAERQVVEIARAVSRAPHALLLDEPTSALSGEEVDALFRLVQALAARGVAVVHVTHRLDEVPRIARRVSVLRDGRTAGTLEASGLTARRLAALMFGDAVPAPRDGAPPPRAGTPVLSARGLRSGPRLRGVDLEVFAGEVLGVAGLLGSGRSELLLTLFGARRAEDGTVAVDGIPVPRPTPRRMIARGLALVPEDRKAQGLALPLPVLDNASLPSLRRMARWGLLSRARQRAAVDPVLARLRVVHPGTGRPVSALSGGNQQKVVVGKWLHERRRVLLLDEPTRGIDLHARAELLAAVRALAADGTAVVLVSSELEELREACDRIVVMRDGRIAGSADPAAPLPELLAAVVGG